MEDPSVYSSLALAYLGDAVYELIVREHVLLQGNRQVNKLHKESTKYVNAAAQASLMHDIEGCLTEEEMAVYKRGRNATSHTVPKNQDMTDDRHARGFEALIGWRYLKGNMARIMEVASPGNETEGCKDE